MDENVHSIRGKESNVGIFMKRWIRVLSHNAWRKGKAVQTKSTFAKGSKRKETRAIQNFKQKDLMKCNEVQVTSKNKQTKKQ